MIAGSTPGASSSVVAVEVQPDPEEREADERHRRGVDRGGNVRIGAAVDDVVGEQRGREGQERDPHQHEQVHEEEPAVGARDQLEHAVVVHPHDPDHHEREHVGDVGRPLVAERAREVAGAHVRDLDLEDQQRDRDRDDAVAEGFESARRRGGWLGHRGAVQHARAQGAKLVAMGDTVLYECVDHVATITYHRPEALNAINAELRQDLNATWERFRDDEDAWVGHRHRRRARVLRGRRPEGRARLGGGVAGDVLGDPDDQLVRERTRALEADDRGGARLLPRLRTHRGAPVRLRDRRRRRRVRLPRGAARRADDRRRDAPAGPRRLVERDGAAAHR